MKTADSIEQQEERKNARDNGSSEPQQPRSSRECTPSVTPKLKQRDATRIAAWKWAPGHCPNPGGRPKHDLAAEIAKAVFENNAEALYRAYCKAALRGNAYCFKELADRAYGKLKESHQLEIGPYREMSDADIKNRIAQLEKELGVPTLPAAPVIEPKDDTKPN